MWSLYCLLFAFNSIISAGRSSQQWLFQVIVICIQEIDMNRHYLVEVSERAKQTFALDKMMAHAHIGCCKCQDCNPDSEQ